MGFLGGIARMAHDPVGVHVYTFFPDDPAGVDDTLPAHVRPVHHLEHPGGYAFDTQDGSAHAGAVDRIDPVPAHAVGPHVKIEPFTEADPAAGDLVAELVKQRGIGIQHALEKAQDLVAVALVENLHLVHHARGRVVPLSLPEDALDAVAAAVGASTGRDPEYMSTPDKVGGQQAKVDGRNAADVSQVPIRVAHDPAVAPEADPGHA